MAVMSFEVVGGRIATIRSIVNPDKLDHLGPVESFATSWALPSRQRSPATADMSALDSVIMRASTVTRGNHGRRDHLSIRCRASGDRGVL